MLNTEGALLAAEKGKAPAGEGSDAGAEGGGPAEQASAGSWAAGPWMRLA